MININGNYLEGGGQIVRTALALSAITGKPFAVSGIREGRPNPGLKAQHLTCIKALQQLCDAEVEGAEIGSSRLVFKPKKFKAKSIEIDIGTAGSITLLMQSLLLPSIYSGKRMKLSIKGGTDTEWSMPIDYFKEVFLPQVNRIGNVGCKLLKRGYYPKGGGLVEIKFNKKDKTNQININEQKNLICVKGVSHASADLQKAEVAERQKKAAEFLLKKLNAPVTIRAEYCDTSSTGSGITLFAMFSNGDEFAADDPVILGADSLGEKGKKAEIVGEEAARRLMHEIESKAPVDRHLADNLIPFLALYGGSMKCSEITNHTRTNIYVCEQFLDCKFKIDEAEKRIISVL